MFTSLYSPTYYHLRHQRCLTGFFHLDSVNMALFPSTLCAIKISHSPFISLFLFPFCLLPLSSQTEECKGIMHKKQMSYIPKIDKYYYELCKSLLDFLSWFNGRLGGGGGCNRNLNLKQVWLNLDLTLTVLQACQQPSTAWAT